MEAREKLPRKEREATEDLAVLMLSQGDSGQGLRGVDALYWPNILFSSPSQHLIGSDLFWPWMEPVMSFSATNVGVKAKDGHCQWGTK